MNEQLQRLAQVTSLTQLRLSKYQLIWNREHEIEAVEKLDKPELTKMMLSGDNPNVGAMQTQLDKLVAEKKADIRYAEREIGLLDARIAGLEKASDEYRKSHAHEYDILDKVQLQ